MLRRGLLNSNYLPRNKLFVSSLNKTSLCSLSTLKDKKFNLLNDSYDDGFFAINEKNGFLPKEEPLKKLPTEFNELQNLLDAMPAWTNFEKKEKGYISQAGRLAQEVENNLPNYLDIIPKYVENKRVLAALYRSYTFIASAYLLEPSYQHFLKTKEYGKGKTTLPQNISIPLQYVSDQLQVHPFLDYHYSYSLGNWYKLNPDGDMNWDNLDMACKFVGSPDEVGFIMLHVDISQWTGNMIGSIKETLQGISEQNKEMSLNGLKKNVKAMIEINKRRKEMWKASDYRNYNDFRIFIMGIRGNTQIFGDGVLYEGVSDKVCTYRGQTGAQDDLIPTQDIFTGVIDQYPENVLTEYLMDLRDYRPKVTRKFFKDLEKDCKNIFNNLQEMSDEHLLYLLAIVEQIYFFRNGHWMFVQKYIMSNTKYAIATGGTPIISWIPNQISACIAYMEKIMNNIDEENLSDSNKEMYKKIEGAFPKYIRILSRQMKELQDKNYKPQDIFDFNEDLQEGVGVKVQHAKAQSQTL